MQYRMSQRSAGTLLALLLILTLVASCNRRPPKSQIDPKVYTKEIEQWRQERWKELNSESGWLTLVGLFWLKDGFNKCGSDPSQDIVLPKDKIPSLLAEFYLERGRIFFQPRDHEIKVDGQPVETVLREKRGLIISNKPASKARTKANLTFKMTKPMKTKPKITADRISCPKTQAPIFN